LRRSCDGGGEGPVLLLGSCDRRNRRDDENANAIPRKTYSAIGKNKTNTPKQKVNENAALVLFPRWMEAIVPKSRGIGTFFRIVLFLSSSRTSAAAAAAVVVFGSVL
jgi:hypothetical protein